jgi:HEAT repeat protein
MNEEHNIEELIKKLTSPNEYAPQFDIIMMESSAFLKEFTRRCHKVRQDAAAALVEIGAPAVDALVDQLEHHQQVVRVLSATSLGVIGDVRAVDALIKALNDEDKIVRHSAAEALGKIGDTRAVDPLKPLLEDGEFEVRKAAADAIGKITGTRPKVKGACFIATATMGSYDHPTVLLFRIFRDEFLYKRIWGKHFINQYYRYSPPVAQLIENNLLMKKICYWIILKPCEVIIRTLWAERHSPWKG